MAIMSICRLTARTRDAAGRDVYQKIMHPEFKDADLSKPLASHAGDCEPVLTAAVVQRQDCFLFVIFAVGDRSYVLPNHHLVLPWRGFTAKGTCRDDQWIFMRSFFKFVALSCME